MTHEAAFRDKKDSCHASNAHAFPKVVTDERLIVDGLRRGNAHAFDEAYRAYGARIFTFLLRLSGRRDTAEDLAQETWMKLARHARDVREDTRLGPFLFTIARNAYLSYRRWAMLDLSRIAVMGYEVVGPTPSPGEQHEHSESLALLERALQKLPIASREVLLLVGVEGLEHGEVSQMLGISGEALRQRLSRARAQLAERMEKLENRRPLDA
jgi:RNA polymerase sigma-70 factor (ECF subfamily)